MTNTFSNGATADATQVNQNFTDIINGLSDTTKNISVSAGTFAGAFNAQAAVTLGASSSNDLTINASLASTIAIKTTYSYDIGSSSKGIRSIYLGSSDSAAFGTRVIGATVGSTWTMTLPTTGGTSGYVLGSDGSGTTSWAARTTLNLVTKTANYTVNSTPTDEILLGNTNAFTFTLPAANAISGKTYTFKKIGSDTNALTISRAGSDTIEGLTSIKLAVQYDTVTLASDGSSIWYVVEDIRKIIMRADVSSSTSLSNSTTTKAQFNLATYDPYSTFDAATNYRFTAPIASYYRVYARVRFASNTSGNRFVYVYKNGSQWGYGSSQVITGDSTWISITELVSLAATDYIEIFCFQNSGGPLNGPENNNNANAFIVEKI